MHNCLIVDNQLKQNSSSSIGPISILRDTLRKGEMKCLDNHPAVGDQINGLEDKETKIQYPEGEFNYFRHYLKMKMHII